MVGDPPTSATLGSLRVSAVLREEGLAAKETLAWSPYGQIFATHRNVWVTPFGQTPVRIGDPIRVLLEKSPRDARYAWHGIYYNGFYRLCIPSAAQQTDPDVGLDFSHPVEQWWCDLREWPKTAWWGPMTIPACASTVEKLRDGTLRPLNMIGIFTASGPQVNMAIFEGDTHSAGRLDGWGAYFTSPPNAPVQELWFKEFDFGDPMLDKIVQALEFHLRTDRNATLTVQVYGDGGQAVSAQVTYNPTADGFVLDTGVLDTTTLARVFKSIAVFPAALGSTRFVAKTVQPVLKTVTTPTAGVELQLKALGIRVRPIGRRPAS